MFEVVSAYSRTVTCSRQCGIRLGVKTRMENGSYKKTTEQKELMKNKILDINNEKNKEYFLEYRNSIATKIILNDNGEVLKKECSVCKQILDVGLFRKNKPNKKLAKHNYCSSCNSCEIKTKEKRRRLAGIQPQKQFKTVFDGNGNLLQKECSKCSKIFEIKHFSKHKNGRYGISAHCRDCKDNKIFIKKYGITFQQKVEKFEQQNHKCAICKKVFSLRKLVVDHSHNVPIEQSFRGLLCFACNTAFGFLGDGNEETQFILENMLKYNACHKQKIS